MCSRVRNWVFAKGFASNCCSSPGTTVILSPRHAAVKSRGDPDDNKTTLLADQRLLFVRGAARVVLRAWRPHEFPNMLAVYYRAHPIQHLA
jgi:hypothetical protein